MFNKIKEFLIFKNEKKINEENFQKIINYSKELEKIIYKLSYDFSKIDLFISGINFLEKDIHKLEIIYLRMFLFSFKYLFEKDFAPNLETKLEIAKEIESGIYILLRRYEPNYLDLVKDKLLKIKQFKFNETNLIDIYINKNIFLEDFLLLNNEFKN